MVYSMLVLEVLLYYILFYTQLAQLPTPIHRWSPPGLPEGFDLFIKRDDLTGSTLSGNKVKSVHTNTILSFIRHCTDFRMLHLGHNVKERTTHSPIYMIHQVCVTLHELETSSPLHRCLQVVGKTRNHAERNRTEQGGKTRNGTAH